MLTSEKITDNLNNLSPHLRFTIVPAYETLSGGYSLGFRVEANDDGLKAGGLNVNWDDIVANWYKGFYEEPKGDLGIAVSPCGKDQYHPMLGLGGEKIALPYVAHLLHNHPSVKRFLQRRKNNGWLEFQRVVEKLSLDESLLDTVMNEPDKDWYTIYGLLAMAHGNDRTLVHNLVKDTSWFILRLS